MVFATVLTNLLLVSAALAASSSEARLKHRRAAGLQSINTRDDSQGTSTLLAGALYYDVQNAFTVVSASAYVSIDGFSCQPSKLQTGVEINVRDSPAVAIYTGFYDGTPGYRKFDDTEITFKEGDRVKLTVNATSKNTGFAINNGSTDKVARREFTSGLNLYQQDAGWVVERDDIDVSHFSDIVFSNAFATTPKGDIGPVGAGILDIQRNKMNYTSTSFNSSSVTIQRLQTPVESFPVEWIDI